MSAVASDREGGASVRGGVPVRSAFVVVAAVQGEVGIWGTIAPKSFFDNFPGAGHHWVSMLGVYNEHLVRDYAAMEIGLAVLLIATAIWFERRLVLIAGTTFLAATVPHFAYHLTTTRSMSTADNTASLGSFLVEIALVAACMIAAVRTD